MIRYFLLSLAAVSGLACAAPPAVQSFFEDSQFKDAKLSPSGRYVALRVGDSKQRDQLMVFATDTLEPVGGARMSQLDVGDIRWVNDQRLVFNVVDRRETPGNINYAPGLYAVNRDGKGMRQLVNHEATEKDTTGTQIHTRIEPWNTFLLDDAGAQDSDYIYLQRPVRDKLSTFVIDHTELVKLNTSTGLSSMVARPVAPQAWLLDSKGEPAIMISEKDGRNTVHYRAAAGSEWRALASFDTFGKGGGFEPVGFSDDQHLLVRTSIKNDKVALHVLDLATGKIDPQPLIALSGFDFSGKLVYINKHLAGVHYLADARASVWFDEGMKAAQADVDKQMGGLINIITPPALPDTPWMLVASYSDRQPQFYSLYNSKSHELKGIGSNHPGIRAAEMGQQDLVKLKARDGMEIPAWLTLPPKGGKKLPLVVLVHGGPYVRGTEWGWEADSQFLASRGYAVVQPEFRGTTGYGMHHFTAGWKQWGLKMQDDIADSVKWAVAQGYADPNRVCIMGGSYGGYATLMGLVKDGDLYRCGIAYAAVSDIPLLLDDGNWMLSDMGDSYKKYGAPKLVGDVQRDAAQLEATSPLKQAARIKRPLLLAHGSDDRRVPRVHFTKMRSALEANKADAEFVEYTGEGHGWSTVENRVDFWTRVEKFLDKHIGAGAKTE
ncbi:alpha/beta hydrolase family protein [Pseudoduganella violaceinigra]|uniref:alpha/beta hydrolase family protein n=1 Tax=Pseudoduganella violaceinigra TaxID=246602 RepID=UPI0004120AF9|nr:alpha/beta fold hydrolase [Pseudoduganella violaceinigra]